LDSWALLAAVIAAGGAAGRRETIADKALYKAGYNLLLNTIRTVYNTCLYVAYSRRYCKSWWQGAAGWRVGVRSQDGGMAGRREQDDTSRGTDYVRQGA
jgi:hypothetical protein